MRHTCVTDSCEHQIYSGVYTMFHRRLFHPERYPSPVGPRRSLSNLRRTLESQSRLSALPSFDTLPRTLSFGTPGRVNRRARPPSPVPNNANATARRLRNAPSPPRTNIANIQATRIAQQLRRAPSAPRSNIYVPYLAQQLRQAPSPPVARPRGPDTWARPTPSMREKLRLHRERMLAMAPRPAPSLATRAARFLRRGKF